MNTNDLAWNGTTVEQKRDLLARVLEEREELIAQGKFKDGHLGVASACVDIIHTAQAGMNIAHAEDKQGEASSWQALMEQATAIAREAIAGVESLDKSDWMPSDFEVLGAVILLTEEGTTERLQEALLLFGQGLQVAMSQHNLVAVALIISKRLRAYIALKNTTGVQDEFYRLTHSIKSAESVLQPRDLARLFRVVRQAGQYLESAYAQESGSANQMMKAEGNMQ